MKYRNGNKHQTVEDEGGPFRNGLHGNPRLPRGMVNDDGTVNVIEGGLVPDPVWGGGSPGWRELYEWTTGMGFDNRKRGL